jgi:ABC-type molybdate transport system substrate-binding protein
VTNCICGWSTRARLARLLFALLALAGCRSEADRGAGAAATAQASASASASAPRDVRLIVLAVPSLKSALDPLLGARYEKHKLELAYLPAAAIASRLEAAPSADVVVVDGEAFADRLEKSGKLVPGSKRKIGAARLAFVGSFRSDKLETTDALETARFPNFVLADPERTPAGAAAKRWLESERVGTQSLWKLLEPKLQIMPDAAAAMAMIEKRGRVFGIVYEPAARRAHRSKLIFVLPDATPAIGVFAAQVARRQEPALARQLLELLAGADARRVLAEHGFAGASAPSPGQSAQQP